MDKTVPKTGKKVHNGMALANGSRQNVTDKLGRKVRQTLPTLLFVDPAGGKVKKRALLLRHICR